MKENRFQKIMGYNNSKGLDYIKVHLRKYDILMKTFVSPNLNPIQKLWISLDFMGCVLKYGAGINDYFQYNFYKRKASERKNFIVGRKWHYIIKKCNGTSKQEKFDNKVTFNKLYNNFLGRDWLDTEECTFEEFESFVNSHSGIMSKIKDGSGGNGIGIYNRGDNLHEDFENLRNQKVMLEEIIVQHSGMAEFNPECVNTMRIVTIRNGNRVYVMNAVFRCGNGEGCTDNFHHFGIAALIDVKTGIVSTSGVDKNNHRYVIHPRTKKKIVGFEIPYWDKIIRTVTAASKITPEVRYVGWDVAIQQDGRICIIEGNCASDPDITQMPDQTGKWRMYKKILDKLS